MAVLKFEEVKYDMVVHLQVLNRHMNSVVFVLKISNQPLSVIQLGVRGFKGLVT